MAARGRPSARRRAVLRPGGRMAKKRRGRGEGGLFELGDGRWMARVYIRDAFGRSKPIQRVRKRKEDARAALLELQGTDAAGRPLARGSVGEFVLRWMRDVAPERLDPGT